jgi:hypothetical protein
MDQGSLTAELHRLLERYIDAPVECDGFTRLAHGALESAGIDHACMRGRVVSADGTVRSPIHFWIELPDGRLIDYRARMWLGDFSSVPHGIFLPDEFAKWQYQGEPIILQTLSPVIAELLLSFPALPSE